MSAAKPLPLLAELVGKVVCVVTLEGRCLVGTLRGVDAVNNLVLENTHERTFHEDRGMEMEPMGLYLVRGDSLCVWVVVGVGGGRGARFSVPFWGVGGTRAPCPRSCSAPCARPRAPCKPRSRPNPRPPTHTPHAQRAHGRGGPRAGRVGGLGRGARRAAGLHRACGERVRDAGIPAFLPFSLTRFFLFIVLRGFPCAALLGCCVEQSRLMRSVAHRRQTSSRFSFRHRMLPHHRQAGAPCTTPRARGSATRP